MHKLARELAHLCWKPGFNSHLPCPRSCTDMWSKSRHADLIQSAEHVTAASDDGIRMIFTVARTETGFVHGVIATTVGDCCGLAAQHAQNLLSRVRQKQCIEEAPLDVARRAGARHRMRNHQRQRLRLLQISVKRWRRGRHGEIEMNAI